MRQTSVYLFVIGLLLVNYCSSQELFIDGPSSSMMTQSMTMSPLLQALFQLQPTPLNPFAAMRQPMLAKNSPEISRVVCGCDAAMNEKCKQASKSATTMHDENSSSGSELTFDDIKKMTEKLDVILNKKIFRNVVKRSVEEADLAKDEMKSMMKMLENIKSMFDLTDGSDMKLFKSHLMSMPDKKMPIKVLIKTIKSNDMFDPSSMTSSSTIQIIKDGGDEECDQKSTIECGPGTKLKIVKAEITNKNKYSCPSSSYATSDDSAYELCSEEIMTSKILNETCSGKQRCSISVDKDFTGICHCAAQRYLSMTYMCVADEVKSNVLDRSKRAVHYRNRPAQMDRDRALRRIPSYGDYYGYGYGYDYYGFPLYGGALPFYDYYGYGYGFPLYDGLYPFYDTIVYEY